MNHFVFSAFLTFVSSFSTGIYFVCKPYPKARILGAYWLTIAFWSFTVGLQFQLLRLIPDTIWGWFLHLGCVYIPAVFFHFATRYSGYDKKSWAVLWNYLLATFFILLNTFTPFFTQGTVYRDHYAYPRPALVYPVYFIFFVTTVCWGTFLLFKSSASLPQIYRNGLFLFLLLNLLAYSGAMDNFLIMADIRVFPLYPFGLYLVPPYVVLGSFALKRSLSPDPVRKA